MNVALTGSSGFIGSHVLTDLVAHGHEVTALVRSEKDATPSPPEAPRPRLSICTIGLQS